MVVMYGVHKIVTNDNMNGFSFDIISRKDGSTFSADVVKGCICIKKDCKTNLKAIHKAMCIYDDSIAKAVAERCY